MELNENDAERKLLKHADLNFDGFEDVQFDAVLSPSSCEICILHLPLG